MRLLFSFVFICFSIFSSFSQELYNNLKKGIDFLEAENFGEAEANFKKAIEVDDTIMHSYFNLGNAVFMQERYDEARENYEKAISFSVSKVDKAEAYHNIGNSYLAEEKWEESIKAFISALKNNSKDSDTKYNLAYAQNKLKKEQEQQKQDKDKKDDKDKDKDKDKKEDKDDKKDKQDDKGDEKDDKKDDSKKPDDKKDGDKEKDDKKKDGDGDKDKEKEKKENEGKPKPQKLSKEEAERLLRAIESQEQKLQDKKKREDMKAVKIDSDKDW